MFLRMKCFRLKNLGSLGLDCVMMAIGLNMCLWLLDVKGTRMCDGGIGLGVLSIRNLFYISHTHVISIKDILIFVQVKE